MKEVSFSKYIILLGLTFMGCTMSYAQNTAASALPIGRAGDSIVAQYPGGIDKFVKYMGQNIRYPLGPQLRGKPAGRVYVSFIVDTTGAIIKPKVKKSVDHEYDKDILRVLAESPRWIPGSIKGKKVNISFDLPIRFHNFPNPIPKSAKDIKNTNVILHGNLLHAKGQQDAMRYVYTPFFEVDAQFSKALFGPKYNEPLFIVNDLDTDPKEYNKRGFTRTLQLLGQSDSTKFKFQLNDRELSYSQWRKYLTIDSVAMLSIYSLSQVPERKEDTIWGIVSLLTEPILDQKRKAMIKASADKATFSNILGQYRIGKTVLPAELIYIDNYYYNTKAIFDFLDMSVIDRVRITKAEQIKGYFQDDRKKGYMELYTKNYRVGQEKVYREKLEEILASCRKAGQDTGEYTVFLNNQLINLQILDTIDRTRIQQVHIISKETAKTFFGKNEQKPIIYVIVDYSTQKS